LTGDVSSPTSPRPGGHRLADASVVRLLVALVLGGGGALAAWSAFEPAVALVLGWVVAAGVFAAWTWATVWPMGAEATATHATREEPSRTVTHLIVLLAAVASLVVVGLVLATSNDSRRMVTAGIAVLGVVVSWATVHTLFSLNYARLYYTGPDGGIDFHQDEPPRYSDFLYIGVTVGMSFAISDTDLESSDMRRAALAHALLSYLFGSVILAGLVNLVAGL
jgi:uncharacterized membrane protein